MAETKPTPSGDQDRHRLLAVVRGPTLTPKLDREEEVPAWPHLIFIEFVAALTVIVVLWVASLLFDAPLEEMANPAVSPNPAKAPWYFVGLQELLHYFDPWIAGVAIPTLALLGLAAIPYLDVNRQGTGEYAPRKRPFAYIVFLSGFFLWFILILVGQLCRGPGWAWYWPGESWDIAMPVEGRTWDLSPYVGVPLSFLYLAAWLILPGLLFKNFRLQLGGVRYVFVMALLALMVAVPLKILLVGLCSLKYVVVTPWFKI